MFVTRRDFLATVGAAGAGLAAGSRVPPARRLPVDRAALGFPDPARHWHGDSSVGAALRAHGQQVLTPRRRVPVESPPTPVPPLVDRFADLPSHFIFEYYPWYSMDPIRHWEQWDRHPPIDLASNFMPQLGAYDSKSTAVMEQHAKWIAGIGAGAINVSWWGKDSDTDRLVPSLMDVMSAHGIQVTFHLEPYSDDHALNYARDIQYLVTQYGDRRHWDCLLLLQNSDGTMGPVFKSFRTILPPQVTDCHGATTDVPDYAADSVWHTQTDRVRTLLAGDFDRVTLLADSLGVPRVVAGGFDGFAIYDNFVEPNTWRGHAQEASSRNLVFSFNVNPGFDSITLRHVDPGACYSPPGFEPGPNTNDWTQRAGREAAAVASVGRIVESFQTTLALQNDATLANVKRGFFLTYLTSFNEWHEGHQFEPMKDRVALSAEESAIGYHNPDTGSYRLTTLRSLLAGVLNP